MNWCPVFRKKVDNLWPPSLGYPRTDGNYSFITRHPYQWANGNESHVLGYACEIPPAKNDHRRECPHGTVTGLTDVCYQFNYAQSEFFPAALSCSESGGVFISVHEQRTNNLITDVIAGTGFQWFFLGAFNMLKESDDAGWVWEDNTPFVYTNWAAKTSSIIFAFIPDICI